MNDSETSKWGLTAIPATWETGKKVAESRGSGPAKAT